MWRVPNADKNYGKLEAVQTNVNAPVDRNNPTNIGIKFTGVGNPGKNITAHAGSVQFSGGSIQASLDMLGKKGTGTPATDNVRGYEFYRNKLNSLAKTFAEQMNDLNKKGGGGDLFTITGGGNTFDASNIAINTDWINGKGSHCQRTKGRK